MEKRVEHTENAGEDKEIGRAGGSENLAAIALPEAFQAAQSRKLPVKVAPSENAHRKPFPRSISTVDQLAS
jgi:hypothetical protein